MGTRKGSLVGMAAAESEKRYSKDGPKPESSTSKASKNDFRKRVGIIVLSTILIVLGIGSVFYFYGKSNIDTTTLGSKIQTIIFADNDLEFNVTDLSRRQAINELAAIRDRTQLSIGRIENIFLTESFIDEEGVEKRTLISANNFLNLIDVQIPTSFLRSLARDFMIGVHVFDGNQPFIILKTNFYENAFVGMLEWERYIKQDLSPFFDQVESTVVPVKTATTTTEDLKALTFNDLVIKNKDTRILKDANGNTVLIYSFVDKNTIVITTNESTFGEILTRLTSSRTIR